MSSKKINIDTPKFRSDIAVLLRWRAKSKGRTPEALKAKEEYKLRLAKIAKLYGRSEKTIYREMEKKVPGKTKTRKDSDKERKPLSKKNKSMISELVNAGHSKQESRRIIEKKTGEKISDPQLNKADIEEPDGESNFGSDALEFFKKLFELDFIAPDNGLKIKFKGMAKPVIIPKSHVEDTALILADALDCSGAEGNIPFIDKDSKMRNDLYYLIEEEIRKGKAGGVSSKELSSLTKQYKDLRDPSIMKGVSTSFVIVERALKKLNPKLTRTDVAQRLRAAGAELEKEGLLNND